MATPQLGIGNIQTQSGGQTQLANIAQASSGSSRSQSTGQAVGTQAGETANVYQPWQSGLQEQAGQAAGNFLQSGNLPGSFAMPPQVAEAYASNFNRFVAPGIAAQGGAGSPAIASQMALGLEQLTADMYRTQSGNFGNALGQAQSLGFTPVGATQSGRSQEDTNAQSAGSWQQVQDTVQSLAASASGLSTTIPRYF
jgi:hypothetical protein